MVKLMLFNVTMYPVTSVRITEPTASTSVSQTYVFIISKCGQKAAKI